MSGGSSFRASFRDICPTPDGARPRSVTRSRRRRRRGPRDNATYAADDAVALRTATRSAIERRRDGRAGAVAEAHVVRADRHTRLVDELPSSRCTRTTPSTPLATRARLPAKAMCGAPDAPSGHRSPPAALVDGEPPSGAGSDPHVLSVRREHDVVGGERRRDRALEARPAPETSTTAMRSALEPSAVRARPRRA